MAERRQSTRGRPPNYKNIHLNPTCEKWFISPTTDPNKSENNISKLHQDHYKESCLKRLLEEHHGLHVFQQGLSIEDIQASLNRYFDLFPEKQEQKILTEYYTIEYLTEFHKRFFKDRVIPIHPMFKPIQSILNKKEPFIPVKDMDMNNTLTEFYQRMKQDWVNLSTVKKINYASLFNLYQYTIIIILEIEKNPAQLKNRKLLNTFSLIQIWESTFPKKHYYIFSSVTDEMSILLYLLHTYFDYRLTKYDNSSGKMIYPPLTEEELMEILQTIQRKLILIFGIQSKINTIQIKQHLHSYLNLIKIKELYQYLWFFIEHPVVVKKKLINVPEDQQNITCVDLFSSIHESYKEYQSSLLNKCHLLKPSKCDLINQTRKEIIKTIKQKYKVYTPETSWEDPNESYVKIEVNRKQTLIQLFKRWYSYWSVEHSNSSHRKTQFWLNYFDVTFEGEEGYFVGVQTDLLQTCMNQIDPKISNIFIPTHESSDRYQINPNFTLSDEQLKELNGFIDIDFKNKRFTKLSSMLFMEFLGGLISRCLLSSVEMPMKLSYFTLAYLYTNNHFEMNDYGFYFSMDHLPKAKPLLNLLTYDPSILEDVGLEFNDQYPLAQINEPKKPHKKEKEQRKHFIHSSNILDYINRTGKYVLTTLNINDETVIGIEARKTYKQKREMYMDLLESFNKGFFINIYGTFSVEQLTIYMVDTLLCQGGVAIGDLNDFVKKNLKAIYSQDDGTVTRKQEIDKQKKIVQWFKHLLTHPIELPYDEFIPDSAHHPKTSKEKKDYYYRSFLPKLISFWSSSRSINMDDSYTLDFKLNDPIGHAHMAHQLQMFPIAHTCSKTLDIPTYLIDLKKDAHETWETYFKRINIYGIINDYLDSTSDDFINILLSRLCKAIYETSGFGMAGGTTMADGMAGGKKMDCITYVKKKCDIEKDYNKSFLCGFEYKLKCEKKFTPQQEKRMITYARKNAIDFQNSTVNQLIQWTINVYQHK